MNAKTIIGVIVLLILIGVGWFYVQYKRQEAKFRGASEIAEESFKKDGKVANIKYVGVVNAPLDKVQEAVWGVEKSAGVIESIKKAELVKQEGNSKTVLMQLQAGSLPLQQFVMVFTLDEPNHAVKFKTTQAQAADLEGTYSLEADGDKTLLTYEAVSTDKIPVPFPDGVIESANREVFVTMIRGITKQAGGTLLPTPAS
ncbi:MAG: hypothetical protein SF182_28190 [Deltaproteobacteria bacterium]|nr:hypothetical protein [Deltaproteobacteria bacterium]